MNKKRYYRKKINTAENYSKFLVIHTNLNKSKLNELYHYCLDTLIYFSEKLEKIDPSYIW